MKACLKFVAVCCLAVLAVIPALAQDAPDPGAVIYKSRCAMCHGADGLSNTPAGKAFKSASFLDPAIIKKTDAEMIAVVKTGKNKMPVFGDKLTDDQIKSVVAYIRTLQKS